MTRHCLTCKRSALPHNARCLACYRVLLAAIFGPAEWRV